MVTRRARKRGCEICEKQFCVEELYPVSLIRNNLYKTLLRYHPEIDTKSFICFHDLHELNGRHYHDVLEHDKGELDALEQEVIHSIKDQQVLSENINEEFAETLTFGERFADKIAEFGGSWTFIICFGVMLFSWMGINAFYLYTEPFDPYPFILLNLVLSCLAAIQAPIIMMSQNRHSAKDRLKMDHDYMVNLKAELQVRQLNARLEVFMKHSWEKMHEIRRLVEEVSSEPPKTAVKRSVHPKK